MCHEEVVDTHQYGIRRTHHQRICRSIKLFVAKHNFIRTKEARNQKIGSLLFCLYPRRPSPFRPAWVAVGGR